MRLAFLVPAPDYPEPWRWAFDAEAAALERLSNGEYGTCVECEEAISPARLRALPEVQTCVRCQDRIERLGRQFVPAEEELENDDD